MSNIKNWSKTAASNNSAPPNGAPEGMAPSTVNNTIRQQMSDHRTQWEDAEWFDWGHVPIQQTANSFLVSTTATQIYTPGRRLRLNDAATIYGTVISSSPSGANTIVTITASSITSSLTSLSISIIDPANPSIALKRPTRQVFLSGSGTYTTPIGCLAINVRLIGTGGPGSGNGASGAGTNGDDTTFSTLTGGGGKAANGPTCGAGGTATGGDINIPGGAGCGATLLTAASNFGAGGQGGSGAFGGGGSGGNGNANGGNAATNSGAGGGGGGSASGGNSGTGGGCGGYVEKLISSPAATYAYSLGTAKTGTAGSATTGGTSAVGQIIVDEFY